MSSDLNVRSVARAVSILEQFTVAHPELRLTEISVRSGLSISTTHRLLAALRAAQMVEFDNRTARYRLSLKNFRLGTVASKNTRFLKQVEPILRRTAEATGETLLFQVVDGNEALCLRRFEGSHGVQVPLPEAGGISALNCGAGERVLLAHLPKDRWDEVVTRHVRRMTRHSLVFREELESDRNRIRERGYAVSWEDVSLHSCGMGAPVRDITGAVVAAVSITGIVQRFSLQRLPVLAQEVAQLGEELSRRLGYAADESQRGLSRESRPQDCERARACGRRGPDFVEVRGAI